MPGKQKLIGWQVIAVFSGERCRHCTGETAADCIVCYGTQEHIVILHSYGASCMDKASARVVYLEEVRLYPERRKYRLMIRAVYRPVTHDNQ